MDWILVQEELDFYLLKEGVCLFCGHEIPTSRKSKKKIKELNGTTMK